MTKYYQLILTAIILAVGLFWLPQPAEAAINKTSHGRVVDQNGLGVNGIPVQYRLYRPKVSGDKDCTNSNTSNCCYRDAGIVESDVCKTDNLNLDALTRDDPYDGTGPGYYEIAPPCGDLKYYIFIKGPGASDYSFAGYNPAQAMVTEANSKVLGATPPPVVPDGCTVKQGTIPGRVVGNVNESIVDYTLECKPPTTPACNAGCSKDDVSSCNPDTTKVPGCSCILDSGKTTGTCGVCPTGQTYDATSKTCQPNPSTPPPVQACNGSCDISTSTGCQAGGNSCNCVDQGNGAGVCQVCPVGTTYDTTSKKCLPPPACNVSCVSDTYCNTAKDGCTACVAGANGAKTCQKKFSQNMCQCDGIEVQGTIVPGQKSNFVAYAKVAGSDQNIAQVKSLAFHVAKDNTVIYDSSPVTVTVDSTNGGYTRYKATFSYTFPANIDPKSIYRVYVDSPSCSQKTAMVIESATQVLGAACVDNRNAFEKALDQVQGWITGNDGDPCDSVAVTDAARASSTTDGNVASAPDQAGGAGNLQLKTFGQATVTDKSCRFVFFRFSGT